MTDDLLDEATRLAGRHTAAHRETETSRILRALVERVQQAEADVAEYAPILDRQGELLTGVANALRGDPPTLTTWSHHDLPELAAEARGKLDKVRALADEAPDNLLDELRTLLAILDAEAGD